MSDWDDDNFSGIDWDGNGFIDGYDYEFDREVYQESFTGNGRRGSGRQKGVSGMTILLMMPVAVLVGIIYPPIGVLMLVGFVLGLILA